MNKKSTLFFMFSLFLGINIYSQIKVTLDPSEGNLNEMIMADTNSDGSHDDNVYVLQRDATYYVNGTFENTNFKLHMIAEEGDGAMPIVRAALTSESTVNWCMFTCLLDVEVEGIFFDAQVEDEGYSPSNWCFVYYGKNADLSFNNCVFANTGQGGVGAWDPANEFTVTNCKFYNIGNIEFSDQGVGRMIECRDAQINKLTVKHNTMVNCYDRIVRHRNGSGVIKEMDFSHNTIVNHGGYFGFMELGNVGDAITIEDNLIIDGMSWAADTSDAQRLYEFNAHGETYADGKNKITWVGAVPNDSTVYTIKNNVYAISSDLASFYTTNSVDEGPKLTDTIANRLTTAGMDADSAFILQTVSLVEIPDPMIDLVTWYYADKENRKGLTTKADYDRMTKDYMLNTLDCSFTVSDDLLGTDGVAVGDSNWFTLRIKAILTKFGEGSLSQTIDIGDSIVDFYYEWENATSVSISGMPEGISTIVDNSEQTISFSGSPAKTGIFDYTISTIGENVNTSVSGTITVNDTNLTAFLAKFGEGSSSQTINLGDSIVDFYYEWKNATSVSISGMPEGITTIINSNEQTISFSGSPAKTGIFDYSILTIGADENTSASGTITINDTTTDVSGTNIIDNGVIIEEPHVYPNPLTNDKLTVAFTYIDKNTKIELYNIIRTLIYSNDNIKDLETIIKLNVTEGNYVLKITNNNNNYTKRLIVK